MTTPSATRLRSRAALVGAATAAALLATVSVPGAAQAAADGPWLDASGLAPGDRVSERLVLRNTAKVPVSVQLRISGLVDEENECIEPESDIPGEECAADGGELSSWLALTVGTGTTEWSGGLTDLATPVTLTRVLPPGKRLPIDVTVELPEAADNSVMSDRATFDLSIVQTQVGSVPDVLGEEEERPGRPGGGPDRPAPGTEPVVLGVDAYSGPTRVDAGVSGALLDGAQPTESGLRVSSLLDVAAVGSVLLAVVALTRRRRTAEIRDHS